MRNEKIENFEAEIILLTQRLKHDDLSSAEYGKIWDDRLYLIKLLAEEKNKINIKQK